MDVIQRRNVMKTTLKGIVLLGTLYGVSLHASFEFRSPLRFDARGYQHWFLAPADQAWWYGQMPSEKKNTDWNIHTTSFVNRCLPLSPTLHRALQ